VAAKLAVSHSPNSCFTTRGSGRGRCEGRKPYGYYDGEATALDRIGLGFDRLAARLNQEGVPTRTGKPWHGVVVNRILTGKR
jgi:hypothetical protein